MDKTQLTMNYILRLTEYLSKSNEKLQYLKENKEETQEMMKISSDCLFNTLEVYAYFLNNNLIDHNIFLGFFDKAFIDFYKGIYLKNEYSAYQEFQKLCKRLIKEC